MKVLKNIAKGIGLVILATILVYAFGPRIEKPNLDTTLPVVTSDLVKLEQEIADRERSIEGLKPGNEARLVWIDSIPKKTKYSIVYLHGWSASHEEGAPLHYELAKRYGCNLFLQRSAHHGIDEKDAFLHITANDFIDSAKEAIAIGKQIGEKVLVIGTSTGATAALHLVSGDDDAVAAIMLFSPNVEIANTAAKLLDGPWGVELARLADGGDYHEWEASDLQKKFWTTRYRVEALPQLQALVKNTMIDQAFTKITQPVFVGFYYKNEQEKDNVVAIPAIRDMFNKLSTPVAQKRMVEFPNTENHVITSYVTSKDLEAVRTQVYKFADEMIFSKPIQ